MPVVFVPQLGNVQFPDSMSLADINTAIETEILPKIAGKPTELPAASVGRPAQNIADLMGVEREEPQMSKASDINIISRNLRGAEAGYLPTLKAPEQAPASFKTVTSGLGTTARTAIPQTVAGLKSAGGQYAAELAERFGEPETADLFRFGAEKAQKEGEQLAFEQDLARPYIEDPTLRGIYGGAESLVRNLPSLALGVAAVPVGATIRGATALATLAGGTQVAAESFNKYMSRGASLSDASIGALGEGGVEIITEASPMSFLVNKFGKTGAMQFLGGLLLREVPGEQAATLAQDAIDTAIANPDKTWAEYWAERPAAAYQTLIATITQAGLTAAGSKATQYVTQKLAEEPLVAPPVQVTAAPGEVDTALAAAKPAGKVEPTLQTPPELVPSEAPTPDEEDILTPQTVDYAKIDAELRKRGLLPENQTTEDLDEDEINERLRLASELEGKEESVDPETGLPIYTPPVRVRKPGKTRTPIEQAKLDLSKAKGALTKFSAEVRGVEQTLGETSPANLQRIDALKNNVIQAQQRYDKLQQEEEAKTKTEAPAVQAPTNDSLIDALKTQKEELLTSSGKEPAIKSPARAKFDEINSALQEIEELKAQGQDITAKPGADIVRLTKLLGPKLYGSLSELPIVSVKELLQNGFDAIKPRLESGELSEGRITVATNSDDRTVEVMDNGTGMAPDTLATKFLEIAGTQKETADASGGLGIAKMQFLFGNKSIEVITVRDNTVSILKTTGPQLEAALSNPDVRPNISVTPFDEAVKTYPELNEMFPDRKGTFVRIEVPETYKNPDTGADTDINIPGIYSLYPLEKSPLFRNIDVRKVSLRKGESLANPSKIDPSRYRQASIGKNFPTDEFTPLTKITFGWGDATLYAGTKESEYSWDHGEVSVLSNGVFQFGDRIKGPKVKFYLDIRSRVSPEEPGYPFDLNRQRFSPTVQKDIQKIYNYVSQLYTLQELQGEVRNFGTIQYLEEKGPTTPEPLEPEVPPMDVPTNLLKPGDTINVVNGELRINGVPVPEVTSDDVSKFKIDVSTLTIPQDKINPNVPMLHDNVLYIVKDAAGNELDTLSFVDLASNQFGQRFYDYMRGLGEAFIELRDVTASELGYGGTPRGKNVPLDKEAIGISFDTEYRGVSTRIPFSGMYLNPAAVEFRVNESAKRTAVGMIGTMVHELAHHKVRSHNADFPAEMQRILAFLDASELGFNFGVFKSRVVALVEANKDIQSFIEERFNERNNIKPIGNRLQDASSEQTGDGYTASDLGGDGYTAASYEKLPEGPEGGEGSTGKKPRRKRVPKQPKVILPKAYPAAARSGRSFFSRISNNYKQLPKWKDVRREVSAALRAAPSATRRVILGGLPNYQVIDLSGMEFDVLDVEKGRLGFRSKLPQFDVLTAKIGELEALRKRIETAGAKILERSQNLYKNKKYWEAAQLEEQIELEATATEVDPDTDTSSAYLNGLWNKLGKLPGGAEAKQVYRDRLKFYKVMFNNVRTYMEGEMYRTYRMAGDTETTAKSKAKTYVDKIMPVVKGPYFHMFRTGEFWYQYDLPGIGKGFEMFESESERNAELDRAKDEYRELLKTQGVEASKMEDMVNEAFFDSGNGFSEVFNDSIGMKIAMDRVSEIVNNSIDKQMEKLEKSPDTEADKVLDDAKKAITNELQQLVLQLAPTGSLRKMFARRKLRAGANPDMQRSFADSVLKVSNFFPKVVYAKDMYASLRAAREYVKMSSATAEEKAVAKDYIKEMELRTDQIMSPPTRHVLVRGMQTWNFYQYLSGVASAAFNFVGGNIQATSILFGRFPTTGFQTLIKYNFKHRAAVLKEAPNKLFSIGIEFNKKLDPVVKKARNRMIAENVFNVSQMHDVATVANNPSEKTQGVIVSGLEALAVPFHLSERLMRESGALASFELYHDMYSEQKAPDGSPAFSEEEAFEKAYQDAVNFTREAYGEASTLQRGRYFKDWRALLLQFKSFAVQQTILQYQLLVKSLQLSARKERAKIKKELGEAAAEQFDVESSKLRWQSIRTLSAIILLSFAVTGLKGTPFWWLMSKIIGLIHFLDGDNEEEVPFDPDNFLMNWLEEHMPELGGATIGRGWVAEKLNISTEGRLSYDVPSLWVSEEGASKAKSYEDKAKDFLLGMLGPTPSLFQDWGAAIDLWKKGEYERGLELIAPAGIRSWMVANRVANEGEKTRSGRELISKDEVNEYNVLAKAFGFEPEDWKRKKSTIYETAAKSIAISDRRQEILDAWWMANQETDPELKEQKKQKVLGRKDKFNELYGQSPKFRIGGDTLRQTIKNRTRQQLIIQQQHGINVDPKVYPMLEPMTRYGRLPSERPLEEEEE